MSCKRSLKDGNKDSTEVIKRMHEATETIFGELVGDDTALADAAREVIGWTEDGVTGAVDAIDKCNVDGMIDQIGFGYTNFKSVNDIAETNLYGRPISIDKHKYDDYKKSFYEAMSDIKELIKDKFHCGTVEVEGFSAGTR